MGKRKTGVVLLACVLLIIYGVQSDRWKHISLNIRAFVHFVWKVDG